MAPAARSASASRAATMPTMRTRIRPALTALAYARVAELADLLGDHELLARAHDDDPDWRAVGTDVAVRLRRLVCLVVQFDAQERQPPTDLAPYRHGILPDPSGEHDRVEPAECGRHGGHCRGDPVHVDAERERPFE